MAVSIGLCRLLNLDHTLAATVACLLAAPPGGKTQILSLLRVGSDPDSHSVRESLRGLPGESVTQSDLRFLVSQYFVVLPSWLLTFTSISYCLLLPSSILCILLRLSYKIQF